MGRPRKPYDTQGRTYRAWAAIKTRCGNAKIVNFANYGGRGIRVCERWQTFENFLADMGECPDGMSIDRIDNEGNYEPGNCRWTTMAVQLRNTRQNVKLAYAGETMTVTDWAIKLGIDRNVLFARIRGGWSTEEVLTTPVRQYIRAA